MPTTTVPGFLYDAHGRPAQSSGLGNLHRRSADDDRLRPRPRDHFNDYSALLSPWRHRELVSESRQLASHGQPSALLDQKADYVSASHFRPQFRGTDSAYGTSALPLIEDALRICNLRGYLFDWKTTWRLMIPALATDGRVYVLLTRWSDTGWPALQILESHRIGQRDLGASLVERDDALTTTAEGREIRGAYRGLRINQGIIYNPQGTEVAYRVLGPAEDGSEDRDISARDLYPVARPRTFSEGPTLPEIAAAALDFIGLDLAWEAQLDQQIEDSRLNLIETNATGKYDPGASFGNTPGRGPGSTPAGTPTTITERGMTRIIKTGFEVKAHQTARPSDQWMNFQATGSSRGAAAIRWRSEMLDPAQLKGAATRAFQDQINTLIQETFTTIDRGASRALRYIAAVLTGPPLGVLPVHRESGAWGIAVPPWFEVDRASAKYDLDDVAAGRVSMSTLHARDGKTSLEVYTERAVAYEQALAVHEEHPEVPLEIILGDLGATVQRTGAQPAQTAADLPAAGEEEDDKEEKTTNSAAQAAAEARHAELIASITALAAVKPQITVSPPAVNIAPAAITVEAPDIHITNQLPKPADKRVEIKRDAHNRITGLLEVPTYGS